MAKAGRKRKSPRRVFDALDLPTPEQLASGEFQRDFVTHTETNTKAVAYRRESDVLSRWVKEAGPGFEQGAARAIADCQLFWARMGEPRLIANYGERIAANTSGDGWTAQEAADEIAFRRKMVPAKYFDVFENVVRHNEPAGFCGSRFANTTPQQIQSAKVIVGMVASIIAMRLGY